MAVTTVKQNMSAPKKCVQPSQVKKIMKANKRVGKISKGMPDVIAYAAELFAFDLIQKALGDRTAEVNPGAIARVIKTHKEYAFLEQQLPDIKAASREQGNRSSRWSRPPPDK